jgi:Zn-dependent protease with chaperone function
MRDLSLRKQFLAILFSILMVCPLGFTQGTEPQLPDPGTVAGASRDQQVQLGQQAKGEVYKQMPVLPDSSPVTQYVQQLGKKLEAGIPQDKSWPYEFHVIPEKDINAFAIPGGPIFVNLGTIQAADNEAELAGVIAHEMTHVYMQHSIKQMSKQSMAQGVLGVLGAVLGNGTAGNLAKIGMQVGAGAIFMKYSREDESQADAGGAIIMYKAGYNPKAMADFFQKLESQGGGGGPQFLSDHPNPGNRVQAVTKEIQSWPQKNFTSNDQALAQAKQQSNGTKTYTAQEIADGAKQGVWAKQNQQSGSTPANLPSSGSAGSADVANLDPQQIKPSGNYKPLEHPAFTIQYPDNWQTSGDPNTSVTIAPAACVGQSALACGAVISGMKPQNGGQVSVDDATQQLVQGMEQSNPGLKANGNPQNIQVNGVQGRAVDLTGNSPVQKNGKAIAEHDKLVVVPNQQGSGLISLIFVAPDSAQSQLQPAFQKMLQSLQVK